MSESIEKFSGLIIGRTVASVSCWIDGGTIVINSIAFDDGTLLELWGSCDYCRIDDIADKNGNQLDYRSDNV